MKILMANKFFYPKGGSESIFFDTSRLLQSKGHQVVHFSMDHPDNVDSPYSPFFVSRLDFGESGGLGRQMKAAGRILYSLEAKRKFEALLRKERPDIVHLHNIYHQISPSILHVCQEYNVPAVMTLHDYKLVCPVYTLFTKGRVCIRCVPGRFFWCLLKKCNRSSFWRSLVSATEMYFHHKFLRVYDGVDTFISPSEFLRGQLERAGYSDRVAFIPNFIPVEEIEPSYTWDDETIVYFGRLSPEKGLHILLDALAGLDVKCMIIGDGPQKAELIKQARMQNLTNVDFIGHMPRRELMRRVKKSLFVVLPSLWFENSPRSIFEAFAHGKIVLGARIGGIPELVQDFQTGLTFNPGDSSDLREKIEYLLHNKGKIVGMGKQARKIVEDRFDPEAHYLKLRGVYGKALGGAGTRQTRKSLQRVS
jgi:glycosyltransferase involved in cell wall biosynthesis